MALSQPDDLGTEKAQGQGQRPAILHSGQCRLHALQASLAKEDPSVDHPGYGGKRRHSHQKTGDFDHA